MKCTEIKRGMELDSCGIGSPRVKVLREGNYAFDSDGKRIPIENSRRNKWWVSLPNTSGHSKKPPKVKPDTEALCCFGCEWDNKTMWRFAFPK